MAKIGFIGTGNMGGALIAAACKGIDPSQVVIADHDQEKAKALADQLGCRTAASNTEIAQTAVFIVLAVKPNVIPQVAKEIAPAIKACKEEGKEKAVVTIAAGVPIQTVKDCIEAAAPVIRIMPNTPVLVGQGMILISSDPCAADQTEAVLKEFQELMKEAGEFEQVEEKMIDLATSVSSCSPAFVYMFIEAMADGAVQVGVPRSKAIRLAAKTVQGAASMVLETGEHPGVLKDNVCSPGGSTIVGVTTLEEHGFRGAVSDAIIRSTEKNLSLGK